MKYVRTAEKEVDEFSEMPAHVKSFWEKVVRVVFFNLMTFFDGQSNPTNQI